MKKILGIVILLGGLCSLVLYAQENVASWSSVETGPVISQSVPVHVKAKASERVAVTPKKFVRSAALATAGFPGTQVGPRIFRPPQNTAPAQPVIPEKISGEFTPPFLDSALEKIPYPPKAVRRGWEGRVVLTYEVLADGSVGRIGLTQSSGHALLDETAREAVQKWKFQPALRNGQPVKDVVETPVTFKLEDR